MKDKIKELKAVSSELEQLLFTVRSRGDFKGVYCRSFPLEHQYSSFLE